jgi:hypothetical protein
VSSTELVATITIAGDATLAYYDIAVALAGRKGGIGTMLFEVTQATAILSTESGFGVNDNGEIVGRLGPAGSFYFNPSTGVETLNVPGRAYDLSADGLTVAGFTGVCCAGAFVLERIDGSWFQTVLSKGTSAWASARAVASDAAGVGVIVGGVRGDGGSNNLLRKPTLWTRSGSGWTMVILPNAGTDDVVDDVVGSGLAVGWANDRAAVWTPAGGGVWTLMLIGPAKTQLHGVNTAGSIAVGEGPSGGNTTAARYWTQSGGIWSAPLSLPGSCSVATAVDDSGRILANGCPNGNRQTPAVILPPYGPANIVFLGGLGDPRNQTIAEDISPSGLWITGQAPLKSNGVAVRWTQVF